MIDVQIRSCGPRLAIIVGIPRSRSGGAGRGSLHVGAIALEHGFARVAFAGNGDPVLEEVAVVGRAVGFGGYFDGGQVLDCCCC